LAAVLLVCGACFIGARSSGASPAKTYSQDAKGLEKQFEPLLKAWEKQDAKAIDKAAESFALPDSAGWFSKYFAKEQVQQLVWDQEAEVGNFKSVTPRLMSRLGKGQRFRVQAGPPNLSGATKLLPPADAVTPTTPVPLEQFSVTFIAENGRTMLQLDNFVYVDGAYRYMGKGAFPFWSIPDAARK